MPVAEPRIEKKPVRVSVFMPRETDLKLERIARETERSKSAVVCEAVKKYIAHVRESA